MEWLAKLFTKYPEMGVYLAVGIGYVIGRPKFRGFGLGAVTGSLLGGILIGNFFHVPVSDQAKSLVFLLFLFGIGYSVGPSFFQNLKGDGWRWAMLGIFVPINQAGSSGKSRCCSLQMPKSRMFPASRNPTFAGRTAPCSISPLFRHVWLNRPKKIRCRSRSRVNPPGFAPFT